MNEQASHPSRLQLDRLLMGELDDPDGRIAEHANTCDRCRGRLDDAQAARQRFLERYPTPDTLDAAVAERERIAADERRSRAWFWLPALAAAAAAIVIAVAVVGSGDATERPDGPTSSSLRVVSAIGNTLHIEYTTPRNHLLVFGLREQGAISVLVSNKGEQSIRVRAGAVIALKTNVGAGDTGDLARIVALFSDDPLTVEAARAALEKLAATPAVGRVELRSLPGIDADAVWRSVQWEQGR